MICNPTPTGWEVFYQNAHARLAMSLLVPLRASLRPARWDELLYATAQHDNGWQEWEPGERRTPSGAPRHFRDTPPADLVRQSERALTRVHHASLFGALLVAEHFRSLYGGLADEGVRAMLAAQQDARRRWRRATGTAQADVAAHYAWLRWADRLSLLLCTRALPPEGLRAEVGEASGDVYWARLDGPPPGDSTDTASTVRVALAPWPYDNDAVTVGAEAYRLGALTFPTDDALADALAGAPSVRHAWTLVPG